MFSMQLKQSQPTQPARRTCIRLLGGGAILAAAAVSGCQAGRPDMPVATDQNAQTRHDPRYRWLELAALAPSSHNMQPWLVDLGDGADLITLYVDQQRLLPKADASARQTMVSLGAFLELLCLAAQADGYECVIELFPQGEAITAPVARVQVTPAVAQAAPDELFASIRQRHSNHQVYTAGQTPSPADLSALLSTATCLGITGQGTTQPQQVARLSELAAAAWRAELNASDVMLETLRLTRVGRREIEQHRDGISVQGFWPELATMLGMFPRDRVPAADSAAMKNMRRMGEAQAASAAGWVWLVSPGNSRTQQVAAGQAFVRLHLAATQRGIALQPMSQALENYPQMAEQHQALYQLLALDPQQHTVQMLARIGYAAPASASVRRRVDDFVKGAV